MEFHATHYTGDILLVIYIVPAIIASWRQHRQWSAIVALNLVGGWTIVGWIIAAVWACTADTNQSAQQTN